MKMTFDNQHCSVCLLRVSNCAKWIFRPKLCLIVVVAMVIIVVIIVSSDVDYRQAVKYVGKLLISSESNSKSANFVNRERVDESVAELLKQRVRVLIWVMTSPQTLHKARAVKKTWGTKCDLLLFFSSANNTEIPTIGLDVQEGREHLFDKTTKAFDYIYQNYFQLADWFMKADDDTFVVVENLRHFLYDKNASEPLLTGCRFDQRHLKMSFVSGGAGYVLSREALRRYGTRRHNPPDCINKTSFEDVEMSRCLQRLGVSLLNSTDDKRRNTFLSSNPERHVGTDPISEHIISFHYVTPQKMSLLYYFIYHFRPFGITYEYGESADPKI